MDLKYAWQGQPFDFLLTDTQSASSTAIKGERHKK